MKKIVASKQQIKSAIAYWETFYEEIETGLAKGYATTIFLSQKEPTRLAIEALKAQIKE